jgi:acyl dehydratase
MTIDVQRLVAHRFPEVTHDYDPRDCILYALGVGLGMDFCDPRQLRHVHEECEGGLRALPAMASVLAYAGHWSRDPAFGLDWQRVLHGEQRVELHRPVPTAGRVVSTTRITDVLDKGPGRGAVLHARRMILDAATREPLATVDMVTFARGDGGHGGHGEGAPPLAPMPTRAADRVETFVLSPQAALLYRLQGDSNPLHADPRVARQGGFDRPILHGLCMFGLATWQVTEAAGREPEDVRAMEGRFTAPLYPGETLRTEVWHECGSSRFRVSVPARGVVVLDRGRVGFNLEGSGVRQ